MSELNANDGSFITLSEGAEYTARYRDLAPVPEEMIKALFVGKNKIKALLDQEGVVGIRIYYGINEDGVQNLVLVGALPNGDDVTDLIVEKLRPCPPNCGSANDLNGN